RDDRKRADRGDVPRWNEARHAPSPYPMSGRWIPGQVAHADGPLLLNAGRETVELQVTNTGDRAIQVGSHYHFFEVNAALRFPRRKAFGMRLDIPSGTSVRFEAGQTHRVTLVPFGGSRHITGFNGLAGRNDVAQAMEAAAAAGFKTQ